MKITLRVRETMMGYQITGRMTPDTNCTIMFSATPLLVTNYGLMGLTRIDYPERFGPWGTLAEKKEYVRRFISGDEVTRN